MKPDYTPLDEIDADDDRKLDARLAILMGWQWYPLERWNRLQKILAPSAESADQARLGWHLLGLVPRWSRNRNYVFQIVDYMQSQGFGVLISVYTTGAVEVGVGNGTLYRNHETNDYASDNVAYALVTACVQALERRIELQEQGLSDED